MKIMAFRNKEPKYTADLWTFTTTRDAEGGLVYSYFFNRGIEFNAVTGNFGKVDAYFPITEADVRQLDQIYNFKGPDGVELQTAGVWQVELIAPAINVFGRTEGYKVRLAMLGNVVGA